MRAHPIILSCWLGFGGWSLAPAHAQQGVQAAGGDAGGAGGTASYSVGQVAYLSATGPGGSAAAGPLHPYEVTVLHAKGSARMALACSAYPNPTADGLTLQVVEANARDLTWTLTDLTGRPLARQQVTGARTPVSLAGLPAGAYLLAVTRHARPLATFKIIKH